MPLTGSQNQSNNGIGQFHEAVGQSMLIIRIMLNQ